MLTPHLNPTDVRELHVCTLASVYLQQPGAGLLGGLTLANGAGFAHRPGKP